MPRGERSIQLEDLTPTRRIEENNAASGGHRDDPIPERPNSRMAAGDVKRAAAKAVGVMGLSKKHDPDLKISRDAAKADGTKKSAGARSATRALDKGSARADGSEPARRVTRSNAEITEGLTATARRSPAPRAAEAASDASPTVPANRQNKRTGGARQRVPAPGNVVTVPKGQLINPKRASGEGRSTSSSGGAKPPKKSARGGRPSGNSRSRGADGSVVE
jgi:hypothetical protein